MTAADSRLLAGLSLLASLLLHALLVLGLPDMRATVVLPPAALEFSFASLGQSHVSPALENKKPAPPRSVDKEAAVKKPLAKKAPVEERPTGPAVLQPSPPRPSPSASEAVALASRHRALYEQTLAGWIARHKNYPEIARRRGVTGSGLLRVRIGRDGRLLEQSIEQSTGSALLDRAAADMLDRASPLPPVPETLPAGDYEFLLPVEYRLAAAAD
jgi:protein TonB